MMRLNKCIYFGFLTLLFAFLLGQPSVGKVIKWQDSTQTRQDLLLLGFSEITLQNLSVTGDIDAFEASNPDLKADFNSNYRFSLFANGNTTKHLMINGTAIFDSRIDDEYRTVDPSLFRLNMSVNSTEPIWDNWRFTGKGVYDPNRQWELSNLDTRLLTQPQIPARLELLMRLESDKNGYIEGGSLRPSFKDSKFSLHRRSLFGAYADLHTDHVGAELVGGKLEGKTFREGGTVGIPANGTTGPFELENPPVTRGSEEIKIQIRDRFDETTVLSTETLTRDIDYNIDYLRGRIVLHQPVASESPSSDPIYIVITYDYLREDNDELAGGRATVSPLDNIKVSGGYLHRFLNDNAFGIGAEEPENLLTADGLFKINDHSKGYFEIAGSENPNDADKYSALRAGAETEVITDLKLNMDYQEIDDKFRSFTNSDLNPTKNQKRLQLGGKLQLTSDQSINASFVNLRTIESNGQFNPYDGIRDQKITSLGYRNNLSDVFNFGLKGERREIKDRNNLAHEDNYQNRAIIDVDGCFEDVALLGEFGYKTSGEMIMFRNSVTYGDYDDNNSNTGQVALTLTSKPNKRANIAVTQRLSLRDNRDLAIYDDRQDVTLASVQYRFHENLNTLATGEYKRYTAPGKHIDLWQDNPSRVQRAGTFALEYLPLDKIKALGKIGRHELQSYFADSTTRTTDDFVQGQITYFPTHHLSFNVETDYLEKSLYFSKETHAKDWDLGLKVNWNKDRLNEFTAGLIRRWQHDYSPGENDITSLSYIALLSGSVSITQNFFARGSIKEILLNKPLDDEKTFAKLEVGYDSNSWYRVSLGYERIESDNKDDNFLSRNYTGQGVFVRFSGKI